MLVSGMIWIVEIDIKRIVKNSCSLGKGYSVLKEILGRFQLVPFKAHTPYLSIVHGRRTFESAKVALPYDLKVQPLRSRMLVLLSEIIFNE